MRNTLRPLVIWVLLLLFCADVNCDVLIGRSAKLNVSPDPSIVRRDDTDRKEGKLRANRNIDDSSGYHSTQIT